MVKKEELSAEELERLTPDTDVDERDDDPVDFDEEDDEDFDEDDDEDFDDEEDEEDDEDFDEDDMDDEERAELFGEGFEKIEALLEAAAEEQGYELDEEDALVILGDCYRSGKGGVEQDDKKAVLCYEEATGYDNIDGTQMLGVCFFEGRGIEQDYKSAFMLLCREMDGRNAEIFRCRGLCFLNGWGTEQDYEKAFEEFRVAAENFEDEEADAASMYWLGLCYEEGKGTQPDTKLASKWYTNAAERGHKEAAERLQKLQ